MNVSNKTVLITSANRGIGQALVNEALRRVAKRVYAGTRGAPVIAEERVTPLTLDVTNADHIQRAVENIDALDILINNAGADPFCATDRTTPDSGLRTVISTLGRCHSVIWLKRNLLVNKHN